MRIAVIAGCLATVVGGLAFAQHFQSRPGLQTNATGEAVATQQGGGVVRYAYDPAAMSGGASGVSFVVPARRAAFLGELSPDEACRLQTGGEGGERGERWKACMSRVTGRQARP